MANVIHEAAFRGVFDESRTREAMARACGLRTGPLELALAMHAGGSAGTRSALEERFLASLRRAGLPEPLVNTRVAGLEVDFRWPAARLCVEVDGPGHRRARTRAQDARRDERLRAAGETVVRVPGGEIESGVARVRRALGG